MTRLEWEVVDSSNVSEVAYVEDSRTLCVRFANGGLYTYSDVSPDNYHGLVGAESVGRYLNAVIKALHPYDKFNSEAELIAALDDAA